MCRMTAKKGDKFNVDNLLKRDEIAHRLRVLRFHIAGFDRGSQTLWAEILGISRSRLHNLENGFPLARDMAIRLVHYVPGLTLDWLFLGREEGLDIKLKYILRGLLATVPMDHLDDRKTATHSRRTLSSKQ
jgi:hypothetical protein